MGDDRKQEITRLLKRGLNQYGLGDLEEAIGCWERALEVDPDNRAARDYLETAYEELQAGGKATDSADADQGQGNTPAAQGAVSKAFDDEVDTPPSLDGAAAIELPSGDEQNEVVGRALAAYKEGRMDEAWRDIQAAAEQEPGRLDIQGYVAMMRSERARVFAREVGDQGRVLCLKQTIQELMQLNLTPNEGFLLSQIDGSVSIEELLNLAKDRVSTLEILAKFIREGLAE